MGEDEADEKGLLLARGGGDGRNVLRAVAHEHVGRLRTDQRAPGRAIAGTVIPQDRPVAVLGVDRRKAADERVDVTLEAQGGEGKGRFVVPGRLDQGS